MSNQVHGILLLDKSESMTSNGALQQVKRLFGAKKAGHTGSLDPIATGMLPICFGEATKFSQFLLESDKSYYVTAKLGVQTTTGDSEGEIIATHPVVDVTEERIQKVLAQFLGSKEQIPPMFSAIKHQGRPLYELARKGISIERKPRSIKIYALQLEGIQEDFVSLSVHCSKGTYIRTLIEDIGRELGCSAHVCELRRLSVTPYESASMYTLTQLKAVAQSGMNHLLDCLLSVETAVQVFPAITLSTSAAFYLRLGQPVRTASPSTSHFVRLLSEEAQFLGIGEVMNDGRVKPHRLLASHQRSLESSL